MRKIYTVLSLIVTYWLLSGQASLGQNVDSEDDTYNTVTTFGLTTNTSSGIVGGFAFRQSKLLPNTLFGMQQARYLSIEVVNVKHPKEISSSINGIGSRYIEGKENYLFVVRRSMGGR